MGFVARHAMVSKVRGGFNDFAGTLRVHGTDPSASSAELTIEAASVDTRNADRDAHLKSNDFFAMDAYPQIHFASSAIEQVSETDYRVTGDLTLRGVALEAGGVLVSEKVTLELKISATKDA